MTSEYSQGCVIARFGANSLNEFLQQMIVGCSNASLGRDACSYR